MTFLFSSKLWSLSLIVNRMSGTLALYKENDATLWRKLGLSLQRRTFSFIMNSAFLTNYFQMETKMKWNCCINRVFHRLCTTPSSIGGTWGQIDGKNLLNLKLVCLKRTRSIFYLIHCLGWATGLTIVLLNAHLCFLEIFEHFFAENVCVSPYNPVQL